jgi:hypothetical protein
MRREPQHCEVACMGTEPFKSTDEFREFEMNRLWTKWSHALDRYTFFLKKITPKADEILKQPEFSWHLTMFTEEIQNGLSDRNRRKKQGKLADWEQKIIRYA